MTAEQGAHIAKNRRHWETKSGDYQEHNSPQLNRWDRFGWGAFDLPEDEVGALGEVSGLDVLEYGCGGCQSGIKVAMRGARVTGLDFSATQLHYGLGNMRETGVRFPVVQANGEQIPFAEASFDLAFCDHGVMGFADPFRTVPEVARVLRPGGRFVFNGTTPIIWMAWGDSDDPPTDELRLPYYGMRSAESSDPDWDTTEFQLTYGGWIRLFREHGFVVEDLIELRPPEHVTTTYEDYAPLEWARKYPAEHIWKVRKA
jgi:SAM-dependent methyltransferase